MNKSKTKRTAHPAPVKIKENKSFLHLLDLVRSMLNQDSMSLEEFLQSMKHVRDFCPTDRDVNSIEISIGGSSTTWTHADRKLLNKGIRTLQKLISSGILKS